MQDFRLGDWTVRPERGCIERGETAVHLKPKPMAVLLELAGAGGAVVGRREIFDAVWPNAEVTDDALTQCVVEIRRAFGDSARKARVVQTIPKKGFRLVLPVDALEARTHAIANKVGGSLLTAPLNRKIAALLLATLLTIVGAFIAANVLFPAVADPVPIAVLPFVDISELGDQEYFADGLSEELINRLTKLQGLLVTGRTSSFHFKGRNDDLRDIGAALNVEHLLEGSVRKSGDQLRITAQLIDVESGFHLWSETFDRQVDDIFAVQTEISEAVARALSIRLSVGGFGYQQGGTSRFDAYEEYLRGNASLKQFGEDSIGQAIVHYRAATRIDPKFASAWMSLSDAYLIWGPMVLGPVESEAILDSAQVAREQALTLAPLSSDILSRAAYQEIMRGNWTEAEHFLARAEEIGAGDRLDIAGTRIDLLIKTGRATDALSLAEAMIRRDPLSRSLHHFLGHAYQVRERYSDALGEIEQDYKTGWFESASSNEGLVIALTTRDRDLIDVWLARAVEHEQPGDGGGHTAMAERLNDPAAALIWLHDAFRTRQTPDYWIAIWAAYHHDLELAMSAVKRSPDGWSLWIPLLSEVRQKPGFAQLMHDVGLVEYWQRYGWGEFCVSALDGALSCS